MLKQLNCNQNELNMLGTEKHSSYKGRCVTVIHLAVWGL